MRVYICSFIRLCMRACVSGHTFHFFCSVPIHEDLLEGNNGLLW